MLDDVLMSSSSLKNGDVGGYPGVLEYPGVLVNTDVLVYPGVLVCPHLS